MISSPTVPAAAPVVVVTGANGLVGARGLRGARRAGGDGARRRPPRRHARRAGRTDRARRRLRRPGLRRRRRRGRRRGRHHRPPDGLGPRDPAPGRRRGHAGDRPGGPRRRRRPVRARVDGRRLRPLGRGRRRGRGGRRWSATTAATTRSPSATPTPRWPRSTASPGCWCARRPSSAPGESSVWNTLRPAAMRDDERRAARRARQTFAWVHVDDLAALIADVATGRASRPRRPRRGPVDGGCTAVNVAGEPATWRDYVGTVTAGPRRRAGVGRRARLDRADPRRPGAAVGLGPHRRPRPGWPGRLADGLARPPA